MWSLIIRGGENWNIHGQRKKKLEFINILKFPKKRNI